MTTSTHSSTQGNPRIYALKPELKCQPKPERAVTALVHAIAPAPPKRVPLPVAPRELPPRQPLPTAVLDPARPLLKLGLDVHLEFIMAVVQHAHANPKAPRKFTNAELVAQVTQWVAEGQQVVCVQESCGFGFVLHRQLVAAGAQSFLITPKDVSTTQIYTHVMQKPGLGVRSPLDG